MKIDFTESFFVEPQPAFTNWPAHRGAAATPLEPTEPAHHASMDALSCGQLRTLLLLGCVLSMAVAASVGHPAAYLKADPELATLLRGMAVLKAMMVAAGLAVLGWRFGHPVTTRTSVLYLAGAWLMTGATALIWQLSWLPAAALVFHVAAFTLLLVAWADRQSR